MQCFKALTLNEALRGVAADCVMENAFNSVTIRGRPFPSNTIKLSLYFYDTLRDVNWIFVMSLQEAWKNKFKSSAVAAAMIAAPFNAANANDDNSREASLGARGISFVSDVDTSLKSWAEENPDAVAVGVKLSKTFPLSVEEIEKRLKTPAMEACSNLKTHFMFEVDNPVQKIKQEIAEAAGHVCLSNQLR